MPHILAFSEIDLIGLYLSLIQEAFSETDRHWADFHKRLQSLKDLNFTTEKKEYLSEFGYYYHAEMCLLKCFQCSKEIQMEGIGNLDIENFVCRCKYGLKRKLEQNQLDSIYRNDLLREVKKTSKTIVTYMESEIVRNIIDELCHNRDSVIQTVIKNFIRNDYQEIPLLSKMMAELMETELKNVAVEKLESQYFERMNLLVNNLPVKSALNKPLPGAQEEFISEPIIRMNQERHERTEREMTGIITMNLMAENWNRIVKILCVKCELNIREMLCSPCYHLALCRACAGKWTDFRCPICKETLQNLCRIYWG